MKESIVILRYPGSDWGSDLVCFRLPEKAGAHLLDELNFQRADMDAADFDTVQDLADEYYTAECLGSAGESELICALMTDYSSAYEEVVDTVMEYSKSLSDVTFLLSYDNTDTDVHQHIHIRDGEREVLDGHIVYETPKRIFYEEDKP